MRHIDKIFAAYRRVARLGLLGVNPPLHFAGVLPCNGAMEGNRRSPSLARWQFG
jgi:hypothetical protein